VIEKAAKNYPLTYRIFPVVHGMGHVEEQNRSFDSYRIAAVLFLRRRVTRMPATGKIRYVSGVVLGGLLDHYGVTHVDLTSLRPDCFRMLLSDRSKVIVGFPAVAARVATRIPTVLEFQHAEDLANLHPGRFPRD